MMTFRWEDIDHSLVRLRLVEPSIEMNRLIKADEHRIRFEQRGNLNRNTVPSLILQMLQDRADEWARKTYDIYCDVWQKQGNEKSGAFLRAVFARGIHVTLRARAAAIASEFVGYAVRTAFPTSLKQAHLQGLDLNMRRMEYSWQRRIEIEAKECEHAGRIAKSRLATLTNEQTSQKENSSGLAGESNRQPAAGSGQSVPAVALLDRTRPGPRSKRPESFVVCAGTLWRTAVAKSGPRVSIAGLSEVASELDAAKHVPPADYLEGHCAREVRAFNSRHSRSKPGPLLTWSQLVLYGDKDHLQGMRRLLSRCASLPPQGQLSVQFSEPFPLPTRSVLPRRFRSRLATLGTRHHKQPVPNRPP
jgi:hypothetical protein